jgi:hypothetical protein
VRLKPELLSRLLAYCPDLRSVWALRDAGSDDEAQEMLIFADRATLERLRACDELRDAGARVLVVLDGNRFESAWGDRVSGSLARWEWREASADEAYFDERRPVKRVRREARRIWRAATRTSTATA